MAVPRENHFTPFGDILATPERGTFMSNRGVLHDGKRHIRRSWQLKRWIICVVEFRYRKRQVMTPGRYTELYFLDEATALAAGHRPCAECRHARFLAFCNAWTTAHPSKDELPRPTAMKIVDRLHFEWLASDRSKRSFVAALDELPDGVFMTIAAWGEQAYLVLGDHLLAWKPGGYGERWQRLKGVGAKVLAQQSTMRTIQAGYASEIQPSAVGDA
jgi:hypothetical protein